MSEKNVGNMIDVSMKNMKCLADANTVLGDPIDLGNGTTIIPVSKVSFGFGSGGSDYPDKSGSNKELFGGGVGGGVKVQPVAFIVSTGTDVKIMELPTSSNAGDKVINMVPGIIDKITAFIDKNKKKGEQPADPAADAMTAADSAQN